MLKAVFVIGLAMFVVGQAGSGAPALQPKLTPAKVLDTFMTNEAYADEHYVGKELELTGIVVRSSRNRYASPEHPENYYVLELDQDTAGRGEKLDLDLLFYFGMDDRKQLSDLKPGQTVVIRGKCSQRNIWSRADAKRDKDYGVVKLEDCAIVMGK